MYFLIYRNSSLFGQLRNFQSYDLPQRLKIAQNLSNYLRGVWVDYTDVAIGIFKSIKNQPRRSITYMLGGYGLYECAIRNPDQRSFLHQFRIANNEMIQVPSKLQNPSTAAYMKRIETNLNQNRLRFLTLGILTIMWEDIHDLNDCTYPAVCEYTKITYWNFHRQIIDVGFWNTYWHLRWKLYNYDINYL